MNLTNMETFKMNRENLNIAFEEAMAEDFNNIFDDYQSYIMDNADLSEVNIYSGNSLLEAAESGYLLEEFKSSWMEKELAA